MEKRKCVDTTGRMKKCKYQLIGQKEKKKQKQILVYTNLNITTIYSMHKKQDNWIRYIFYKHTFPPLKCLIGYRIHTSRTTAEIIDF